jgi:hypothetical protein
MVSGVCAQQRKARLPLAFDELEAQAIKQELMLV